jgi:hypothetical protein
MKHKIFLLYAWFVRTVLFFFPDMPVVMRFRGWLYGLAMAKCGNDVQITHDVVIKELENITIGNNCFIGNHSILMGSGEIIIEDEVSIAPHVVLISGNHISENNSYKNKKADKGTILICKGAWIAANSTVQKDTVLPESSVLSANSFLNKAFDTPHSIYGGVPARLIKTNSK